MTGVQTCALPIFIENLVITTPGDIIKLENLPEKFRRSTGASEPISSGDEILPLKKTVEKAEYQAINRAIQQCGSVRKAAGALGVDPSTIVRKLQSYKEKTEETP